jgi:hypothetical protein
MGSKGRRPGNGGGAMNGDTGKDEEERQNQIFKRMAGEEKVLRAMALSDFVRDLALAGLRRRHLGASESQLRMLFIKDVHGVEIRRLSGE